MHFLPRDIFRCINTVFILKLNTVVLTNLF